jgi:hypothetical protein
MAYKTRRHRINLCAHNHVSIYEAISGLSSPYVSCFFLADFTPTAITMINLLGQAFNPSSEPARMMMAQAILDIKGGFYRLVIPASK